MTPIYKGDDVCKFMTITNPNNEDIERVAVQVGVICKSYELPKFPLDVDLTSQDTNSLEDGVNSIAVAVWTSCGKTTSPNFGSVIVNKQKVMCEA